MVLVTISFSARDETTDDADFVWLKTSVACNKIKKDSNFKSLKWDFLTSVEGPFGRCRFAEWGIFACIFYSIIE